ncbi:ATP-binding protein [Nocardia asteroides]|uniref:sensor histidine kinase n=1 Tax=Nocardia asteroides TaxID=1824 RepID=UPI001E428A50|nr:ATP-binding protein [Nocardia asteroides]UGT55167.1 nitrate- and nitrite sensing domain-containing protein [Nocardia asteroides]
MKVSGEKGSLTSWLTARMGISAHRLSSIRTRVLAMVLIPTIALIFTGGTFAGLLLRESVNTREWADTLNEQVGPSLELISAVQGERNRSQLLLAGEAEAVADLANQRTVTDGNFREMAQNVLPKVLDMSSETTAKSIVAFQNVMSQLPVIRQSVDTRQIVPSEVDVFYTKIIAAIIVTVEISARQAKDPEAAAAETVVARTLGIEDLHSRAVGLASPALVTGVALTQRERSMFAQITGGYHTQLQSVAPILGGAARVRFDRLIANPLWHTVTSADEALIETGVLPIAGEEWDKAHEALSAELRALYIDQYRHTGRIAGAAADRDIQRAVFAGVVVLTMALACVVLSARIASRLVRRLRALRDRTLEAVEDTLPAMMRRVHEGGQVDVDGELSSADAGRDEIGQVAEAFAVAQRTALAAAADEARIRSGFNRVFLDIARRSQVVVHQQLALLDIAESKQTDPEHVELLFQLDHLATRARRNAENLLILGGGQPGRRWRHPVAIEEIARSAISETREFARVNAVRMPELNVLGAVVADLIPLLAELVDNATSFSPPGSPVTVQGGLVGNGVVIEVEDRGLGIQKEERDRLNALLADPPEFQSMATAGHRNLGLFVVGQLARRHDIAVTLSESAYGGIKAVVLIPSAVLARGVELGGNFLSEVTAGDQHGRFQQSRRTRFGVPEQQGRSDALATDLAGAPSSAGPSAHFAVEVFAAERVVPPAPPTAGPTGLDGRAALPKRSRLTHLAPQLQLEDATPRFEAVPDDRAPTRARRDPLDAQHKLSSLQSGTRQGRGVRPRGTNENG